MTVGATVAQILAPWPPLALIMALLSHYILDAFPHWDYHLSSVEKSSALEIGVTKTSKTKILIDLSKIALDALLGAIIVLISFHFLVINIAWWLILPAMFLAVLPDISQAFYAFTKNSYLGKLQIWHDLSHHPSRVFKAWPIRGIIIQGGVILLALLSLGWFLSLG